MKIYAVGTHKKHLDEVLEMSTTKDVFHGKIRKKYCFSFEKWALFGRMYICIQEVLHALLQIRHLFLATLFPPRKC